MLWSLISSAEQKTWLQTSLLPHTRASYALDNHHVLPCGHADIVTIEVEYLAQTNKF